MTPLPLYWHTLRWLKPVQFWGRAWFRLHRPRPGTRPAPPLRPSRGAWVPCRRAPSMTGPARFRFLSVERELAAPADWNRADWPRLWRYNLHYFDDLVAHGAADRESWHRALIERWIADNPPGRGTGWEPYPVSLRIVNWIKWSLARGGGPGVEQMRLSPAAVHSLAVQARWLRGRVERHLLGNHLWANAKALVFAGAFFDGGEAARWRDEGLALLRRELREQILPDGGHFERSPMYHATLLEDLLDLVQLAARWPGLVAGPELAAWRATAQRMLRWLRVMTHPDGGIAFFNDAAFEVAPDLAALEDYAANACGLAHASDASFGNQGPRVVSLPEPEPSIAALRGSDPSIIALPDSGYVRLQAGPAVLIADVGAIGPDYLPGQAHADTLSFELSLHGRRAIVNSGTSTYETDAERLRQRGTAAHNTVVVDGADSSEVWSSFRVARRAPDERGMGHRPRRHAVAARRARRLSASAGQSHPSSRMAAAPRQPARRRSPRRAVRERRSTVPPASRCRSARSRRGRRQRAAHRGLQLASPFRRERAEPRAGCRLQRPCRARHRIPMALCRLIPVD